MGINSKLKVSGGEVHTYGTQYKTAVDAVKPARSDLRVIMDRNLGATGALYSLSTTNSQNYPTYGLLYQWGRKDPFPHAAAGVTAVGNNGVAGQPIYQANGTSISMPAGTGPVALTVAHQNPGTFYKTTDDWNSSRNGTLWGDGTTKSVYDPCPEGWRVAPSNTWKDFGTTWLTSGTTIGVYRNPAWTVSDCNIGGGLYSAGDVKAFYPAQGYLHPYSASWNYAGFQGNIWASSVNNNSSYTIGLAVTGINNVYSEARGFCFQMRCIQE